MPVNAPLLRKIADQIENGDEEPIKDIIADCLTSGNHNYIVRIAEMFGMDENSAVILTRRGWLPRHGLTVPQALRLIADGSSVESVSA